MKFSAKKIIPIIIFGTVILNADFSFAKDNEFISPVENQIYLSNNGSEERKREFWEKFRESVKPRERHPRESSRPHRRYHPRESDRPREVTPRRVN